MIKPFSEVNLFELGNDSDTFYATGSVETIGERLRTFSRPLRDKERISVSFPVKVQTKMLSNSSSIYYFNSVDCRWDPPPGASSDFSGPFSNVSMKTQVADGSNFIEDHLCFDHKGIALASGSLPIFKSVLYPSQKIEEEQTFWFGLSPESIGKNKIGDLLARDYPKSLQRNSSFIATGSQVFTLDVNNPFLIEKIVIDVPFCMGQSWFRDRTTECFTTSSVGDYTLDGTAGMGLGGTDIQAKIFDQGGPGLTIALFSQKNYGVNKILDLIGSAYITHEDDTKKELRIKPLGTRNIAPKFDWMQLEIVGNDLDGVDAIVKGSSQKFTGSVNVKMNPSISNGVKISVGDIVVPGAISGFDFQNYITDLLSNPFYSPFAVGFLGFNTFGRGMTGFAPSGGSIFGGEYVSAGENIFSNRGVVRSPFYVSSSVDRATNISSLVSSYGPYSGEVIRLYGSVYLGDKKQSPYLVYPGEKLVLSVSKTRPTTSRFKVNIDSTADPDGENFGRATLLSSSYYHDLGNPLGHDVQFNTGSINITFYGSYVREGNSYKP